jgi:glycosyltransferase involved in cell wall biosynthesis
MKVVVDGFPIRIGSAGIGTYTRELLGALTRVAPAHEYYLADLGPRLGAARVPQLGPGEYDAWIERLAGSVPRAWKVLPNRVRNFWIARQAADLGAAVFLATNFLGVFHRTFRTVLTVHDLSHVHHPQDTYPAMARKLARDLPRQVDRAHAILADSESTKRDVIAHLGVPRPRIHVVYPGVASSFRPVGDKAAQEACRRRYGLPERFLLHVGTLEPRKNLTRLIEAFRRLTEEPRFDLGLVLVGGKGWHDDAITRAIDEFPRAGRIVLTGRVPREDLPLIYSLAEVFVFPSLYEGFGLPVLEAMACGTPVITSSVSSLPEVAGDAALLVDPESVTEIAAAVRGVTADPELSGLLRRLGLARAAAFPWDATARKISALFEETVGN